MTTPPFGIWPPIVPEAPSEQPLPALIEPLTLWVDSVNGSDSNPGTEALPFQDLSRAVQERYRYLEIRQELRVQMVGTGPYVMPRIDGSECVDNGTWSFLGDLSVLTVITTGTLTGNLAGQVFPTSATGGVNNLRDDFLRITSGPYAGALFAITENAANSITIANRIVADVSGQPFSNGETWEVVRPGTILQFSGSMSGLVGSYRGLLGEVTPCHFIFGCRFTFGATRPSIYYSQFGISFCRSEAGLNIGYGTTLVAGLYERSGLLGLPDLVQYLAGGAGIVVVTASSVSVTFEAMLFGVISATRAINLLDANFVFAGGRIAGTLNLDGATIAQDFGTGQDNLIMSTINVTARALLRCYVSAWRAIVTAGSVFRARMQGEFVVAVAITGGTTGAGGFGYDVRGGGRGTFVNVTPQLTGAVLNQDLRTTNVTAANATLNANNTFAQNGADESLGELLCRVP